MSGNDVSLFSSQFLDGSCSGAPLVGYTFYVSNIEDVAPPVNETWSSTYSFIAQYQYYYTCGNLNYDLPKNGDCCISFLDSTQTFPYQSAILAPSTENTADLLLKDANGSKYCYLYAQDYPNALFGYQEAYYLASNNCIDSRIVCSPKGLLYIYEADSACQGDHEMIELTSSLKVFNSSKALGQVAGKLETIKSAVREVSWTTNVPGKDLVPNFIKGTEILGLLCLIAAYLLSFLPMIKSIVEIIKIPQKRRVLDHSYAVNFSLQFVKVCFMTVWWLTAFKSTADLKIYLQVMGVVTALASLATPLITTFVFIFTFHQISRFGKGLIVSAIVCIHIGLCGSKYVNYYLLDDSENPILIAIKNWSHAVVGWVIFSYIWNIIPPLWIAYYLLHVKNKGSTILEKVQIASKTDKFLLPSIALQILLLIMYIISDQAQEGRIHLSSDRDFNTMPILQVFFLATQSFLNTRVCKSVEAIAKLPNNIKNANNNAPESNVIAVMPKSEIISTGLAEKSTVLYEISTTRHE